MTCVFICQLTVAIFLLSHNAAWKWQVFLLCVSRKCVLFWTLSRPLCSPCLSEGGAKGSASDVVCLECCPFIGIVNCFCHTCLIGHYNVLTDVCKNTSAPRSHETVEHKGENSKQGGLELRPSLQFAFHFDWRIEVLQNGWISLASFASSLCANEKAPHFYAPYS